MKIEANERKENDLFPPRTVCVLQDASTDAIEISLAEDGNLSAKSIKKTEAVFGCPVENCKSISTLTIGQVDTVPMVQRQSPINRRKSVDTATFSYTNMQVPASGKTEKVATFSLLDVADLFTDERGHIAVWGNEEKEPQIIALYMDVSQDPHKTKEWMLCFPMKAPRYVEPGSTNRFQAFCKSLTDQSLQFFDEECMAIWQEITIMDTRELQLMHESRKSLFDTTVAMALYRASIEPDLSLRDSHIRRIAMITVREQKKTLLHHIDQLFRNSRRDRQLLDVSLAIAPENLVDTLFSPEHRGVTNRREPTIIFSPIIKGGKEYVHPPELVPPASHRPDYQEIHRYRAQLLKHVPMGLDEQATKETRPFFKQYTGLVMKECLRVLGPNVVYDDDLRRIEVAVKELADSNFALNSSVGHRNQDAKREKILQWIKKVADNAQQNIGDDNGYDSNRKTQLNRFMRQVEELLRDKRAALMGPTR